MNSTKPTNPFVSSEVETRDRGAAFAARSSTSLGTNGFSWRGLAHGLFIPLTLLLAACGHSGGGGRTPCPAGKLCLEAGNGAEVESLDPPKTQLTTEATVLYDLFAGLTTLDADGTAMPGMATRWETSPDGLTWTFHLRDAHWSDGMPVTAQDFVFAFRRLVDPHTASPYAWLLAVLVNGEAVTAGKAAPETLGAAAPDPRTLVLHLTHPAPYLPLLLDNTSAVPVPEHVVRRWGDAWTQPGHMVSNGPYQLASWALNDRLVLVRNPRYYGNAQVCFDQIAYRPISDTIAAERAVGTGELDLNIAFASNRVNYLRRRLPGYVHANPVFATAYIALSSHVRAFADPRVRVALSIAIDRDFIAGKLLRAGQRPAYAFVPPGIANYPGLPRAAWADWPLSFRDAVARELLRRAGIDAAHPLRLEFKYSNAGERIIWPALQSDWRAIGVRLDLAPEEGQILYADLVARNFEAASAAWFVDFNDAISFLRILSSGGGAQNYSDYHSARFDALIAASDEERDIGRRARLLVEAERVAMADAAILPLYVYSGRNLVDPDISGWRDNPADYHPKRFLCRRGVR
ncbi:MAG: peptide ABC transporter substrate-binding protein [Sphingomonadaceae bacterium]|nr:peptide ABC transporter substrate-binding protein [Sphingomonadaceae bacterium]